MCLKNKRRNKIDIAENTRKDRELIAANSRFIDTAIAKVKENSIYAEKLKCVQEKLKYLRPSSKIEVLEYDMAIEKKIIKLNRTLRKEEGVIELGANDILIQIEMLIGDRNKEL